MSRQIENDHLFTDEEVEYLKGRRRLYDIEQNAREFGGENEPEEQEPVQLSEEIVEQVKALSDSEVEAALAEAGLSTEGSDKEQKFALAQHLQREKDAAE